MDIIEIQNIVRKIKRSLFRKMQSEQMGPLKSQWKGMGLQFKEHKVYVHGDDVRFIDWKILAKTQHTYVKSFEQERGLNILVLIDSSCSMRMGYKNVSKLQAAIDVAALLYLLSERTKDKVQVILLGPELICVPRSAGMRGLGLFLAELRKGQVLDSRGQVASLLPPRGNVKDEDKIRLIRQVGLQRKEIVLLSDFCDFLPSAMVRQILSRPHAYGFQMVSPLDEMEKFPFKVFGLGLTRGPLAGKGTFSGQGRREQIIPRYSPGKGDQGPRLRPLGRLEVHGRYLENFLKEMMK